jgi:hypothetical protein
MQGIPAHCQRAASLASTPRRLESLGVWASDRWHLAARAARRPLQCFSPAASANFRTSSSCSALSLAGTSTPISTN